MPVIITTAKIKSIIEERLLVAEASVSYVSMVDQVSTIAKLCQFDGNIVNARWVSKRLFSEVVD